MAVRRDRRMIWRKDDELHRVVAGKRTDEITVIANWWTLAPLQMPQILPQQGVQSLDIMRGVARGWRLARPRVGSPRSVDRDDRFESNATLSMRLGLAAGVSVVARVPVRVVVSRGDLCGGGIGDAGFAQIH